MIKSGKFFIVLSKPNFMSSAALSNADMNALVDSQQVRSKFEETLRASVVNWGGSVMDAGQHLVVELPVSCLQNVMVLQDRLPAFAAFGVGSSLDGAFCALQVADKYDKRIELYIPDKTENLLKSEPEQDDVMQVATPEEINSSLIAELHAKTQAISPEDFQGLLQEFQTVLMNFKVNLPTIETLQVTNPGMYGSILDVVNSATNFAHLLMQAGILNTDLGMLLQQQEAEQAAMQAQEGGEGEGGEAPEPGGSDAPPKSDGDKKKSSKPVEPHKLKAFTDIPINSVRRSGKSYRIKTIDPATGEVVWRYAGKGLSQGPDGTMVPGAAAGAEGGQAGVQEAQQAQIYEEDDE